MPKKSNVNRKIPQPEVIKKELTYFCGFLISLFIVTTLEAILSEFGQPNVISDFFLLAFGVFFFYCGLTKVPIGSQGVMLLLGEQINSAVLEGGYSWILPIFMSVDAVRVASRDTIIETKVMAIKTKKNPKPEEDGSIISINTEMRVVMKVIWQVVNPVTYVLQNSDYSDIEGRIRSRSQSRIRTIAAKGLTDSDKQNPKTQEISATDGDEMGFTDTEFIRLNDEVRKELHSSLTEKNGLAKDEEREAGIEGLDVQAWGVEIIEIIFSEIERVNKGTEDAAEAARQADYRRTEHKTQQADMSDRAKELIRDFGFTPQEALDRVYVEFGRMPGLKIMGENGAAVSPIIVGGALAGRKVSTENIETKGVTK